MLHDVMERSGDDPQTKKFNLIKIVEIFLFNSISVVFERELANCRRRAN